MDQVQQLKLGGQTTLQGHHTQAPFFAVGTNNAWTEVRCEREVRTYLVGMPDKG